MNSNPADIAAQMPNKKRLRRAVPPLAKSLVISLFWAATCGFACLLMLTQARGWVLGEQAYLVSLIYALGGFLAVWPSALLARWGTTNRSFWRFSLFLILLLIGTIIITSAIFALQYRTYFAQWHGEPLSRLWFLQQFFTAGGAVYTYFVLGLRLYVPVAAIGLLLTSWWVNRLPD